MIDWGRLEKAAFGGGPEPWAALLAALRQLPAVSDGLEDRQRVRLATAIAAIVANAAEAPTLPQFLDALLFRQSLENLVRVSPLRNLDHVLLAMGLEPLGGRPAREAVAPETLARATLLLSLDSEVEFGPEDVLSLPPAPAQGIYVSLVGSKPIVSALGATRREAFVGAAERLQPAPMPGSSNHLVAASAAWMLCSYASHPRKHGIKPVLNRTFIDLAGRAGLAPPSPPANRELKERPRMLVAAEIMHSNHVQYRYFGQYLRQLRQRFELLLLTEDREADEPVRALFDRIYTFRRTNDGSHVAQIARTMAKLEPDVVFWPSVGMRHWGPLLANLRFAPIQMTALGHSASTFCEAIDYYVTEEGYVSDPALFGERLLLLPDESLVFERSPHYSPVAPAIREQADPLRIALPSNLLKLNPNFFAVLRRIQARARRPLEFDIFPNVGGAELKAMAEVVSTALPGARVHGLTPYDGYLRLLNACDLNLSPFPFGGLHSVVDSLRQGLPVVALECPEPHGRTDAMLLRRLGLPDWLVAQDEAAYEAAALRVIEDDRLRVELSRQALALDIDRRLFGDATTPLRTEVADAVWWAYRNHEAVLAENRRVIRPADWRGA